MDPLKVAENEKKYVFHSWMPEGFQALYHRRWAGAYFWMTREEIPGFLLQLFNVNAGHQHPKIIKAIKDETEKICYVAPGMANETRAELCRMLAEITRAI